MLSNSDASDGLIFFNRILNVDSKSTKTGMYVFFFLIAMSLRKHLVCIKLWLKVLSSHYKNY